MMLRSPLVLEREPPPERPSGSVRWDSNGLCERSGLDVLRRSYRARTFFWARLSRGRISNPQKAINGEGEGTRTPGIQIHNLVL